MTIHAYLDELDKVADARRKKDDKREGYGRTVLRLAPLTAVQAAYDIPDAVVEDRLERRFAGQKAKTGLRKALRQSAGRAKGRAAGRAIGLASAPLFYSGVKDLKSDDKGKRRRGAAKAVAAGTIFAGGRAGTEAYGELAKGLGKAKALKKLKGAVGTGAAIGVAQSVLTARSIAKGQKAKEQARKKGKKPSAIRSMVAPAATGAAIGGIKGTLQRAGNQGFKSTLRSPGLRRGALAAGGAKAITGAAGGAVAGKLADWALGKGKEKKAADDNIRGTSAGRINNHVRQWAADAHDAQLRRLYEQTLQRGPERSPSTRAVYYAVHDEMEARRWRPIGGRKGPAPEQRTRTHPPERSEPVVNAAIIAGLAAAPALVWSGIEAMPKTDADRVLQDALDRVAAQNGVERLKMGRDFWGEISDKNPATDLFIQLADGLDEEIQRSGDKELMQKYRKGARKFISTGKGEVPEAFAHELGHALVGLTNPFSQQVLTAARAAGVVLPLVAFASLGDGSFATKEDIRAKERFARNVGILAGAVQLPSLVDEARASKKAIELMREAGVEGTELALRSLKLLPGALTYAAPAALPFLAARAIRKKKRRSER